MFPVTVVLVLLASPLTVSGGLLAPDADDVRAVTGTDGAAALVQVGAVIAQGRLVGDGAAQFCEMPPTTFGVIGSGSGQGMSTLQITSDCRMVVAAIDVEAWPLNMDAGPESEHVTNGLSESMNPRNSSGERSFETIEGQRDQ